MEPTAAPSGTTPDADRSSDDATQRVHHHARTSHPAVVPVGEVVTLCGLRLSGPRPDASELPCCPMCAAEMEATGHRCRW